MYDHAEQDLDSATRALTTHQSARTAAAIAACLASLADEASEVGLAALSVFITAAADLAQQEATQRASVAFQPYGRPSLIWSAPPPEQA
ncbi:MAG: hypothetical protein ACOVKO_08410 [Elstera sp.]